MDANQVLLNLSDTEILALTLFGEARGEPIEGIVAVGSVIRNRLYHDPTRYHDYLSVCYAPNQFSCWTSDDPNFPVLLEMTKQLINGQRLMDISYQQCVWVASGIINHLLIDNTGGALNYLTTELYNSDRQPSWSKHLVPSVIKGKQIFLVA